MRALTQADLIRQLAESARTEEEQAGKILGAFTKAVQDALAAGNAVQLGDLGRLRTGDGEAVGTDSFAGAVAAAAGCSEEDARNAISGTMSHMKSELLRAREIQLDGIGVFSVVKEKAKIQKDPKRGHQLLSHPTKQFKYVAPATLSGATFDVNSDLRTQIETSHASTILLVVPEKDFFIGTMEFYFKRSGWGVQTVTSIDEAKQRIANEGTFLVVLDATVPKYQSLARELKCNRNSNSVPLIVVFPKGTNLDRPAEVMVCGDEHIVQPFEVRKLLNICDSELVRAAEEEAIFDQQVLFQFPTEDVWIESANELGHNLFEGSGLREEDQVAMSAAFREAIGNSAQHGNKYRRDKKIEILYLLDREKITAMVKDTGNGFDHQKYVKKGKAGDALTAARDRHKEGKLGGLGIMLMLKCVDRLEYNDKGNSVTLTKYLDPASKPQD